MLHSQWICDKRMSEKHARSLLITLNSAEYSALADFEAINEIPRASRIGNQATNYLESHASVSYLISDGYPASYARQEWRYRVDLSFNLRNFVLCGEYCALLRSKRIFSAICWVIISGSAWLLKVDELCWCNEPIIYRCIYPVKGTSFMHSEVELSTLTCCFDGGFITRCDEYFVVIVIPSHDLIMRMVTSFIDHLRQTLLII